MGRGGVFTPVRGDSVSVAQPSLEADAGASALMDVDGAWSLVLFLASRARAGRPICRTTGLVLTRGQWSEASGRAAIEIDLDTPGLVRVAGAELAAPVRTFLELYAPLVVGPRAAVMVLGHLGQSLDGRVATPTGVSQFITGREDVVHTHRLRALFDAVVVGVRTVELDNPQLTTRLVSGEHPTRVVLDPRAKLSSAGEGCKLLEDGITPTLVCTSEASCPGERKRGHVEWLPVPCESDGGFKVSALLDELAERGLSRVFIEGGGVTVSRFLAVRALHRLHVSVAPMILGSGAPAFALPPIDRLDEALTPRCRHFSLGSDILFDCELAPRAAGVAE
jgi:diaminohydroxyphosphoribosylaminopyrimidine deaminase/5-amino-6-(5-phosphoribosylamino)uracil reductase